MTFYEQELRKLFADGTVIGSPKFTGRACLGTLGKDLRARVQFVTSGHADHYDVISVTVLNRTDGVVDKLRLRHRSHGRLCRTGQRPDPPGAGGRPMTRPCFSTVDGKDVQ